MSSSIFCNPIDPHSEKIDENCVVIFQNTPFPNIISRPIKGFLKPYFVSPIKNLDLRTPLYFIPATINTPEFYLYEYYNTIVNKIVPPDSGCVSPENFSDNSSCASDENSSCDSDENSSLKSEIETIEIGIQNEIDTNEIGIQCNIEEDLKQIYFNEKRIKYLKLKYFTLWFNNFKQVVHKRRQLRKYKKKAKKEHNKNLIKKTLKQWSLFTDYNINLKTKYFQIWKLKTRINKEKKLKIIIHWKKLLVIKERITKNYFHIWKVKAQNQRILKECVILKWKTFLKRNLELKSKFFKIWKKNALKYNRKFDSRNFLLTINQTLNSKSKDLDFQLNIIQILKFLNFDTFQELIKKFPQIRHYINHPEIKYSFGRHLVYFELYCRKLIQISMKNLQHQFEFTKSKVPFYAEHISFPEDIDDLNKILDARIVIDSIRNMYDFCKLEKDFKEKNINALEFKEKQKYVQNYILNDKDINKDVYTIMLGDAIIITKHCHKTKNVINYYCSPLQYLEVIIEETLLYYQNITDSNGNYYLDRKNNNQILHDLSDKIFTTQYRDIIQILKNFIETNVLLKSFRKKDLFDHFHLYLCKIISILDIYRDSYITWLGSLKLYYTFFDEWFAITKLNKPNLKDNIYINIQSKDINSPIHYKLNKNEINILENNMIARFEHQFNENNQDTITNSLGSIFSNINPIICESSPTYKLKIKNQLRVVVKRSNFLETLTFIKDNKCKDKAKEKIMHLRKTKLKKYKPYEYKDLILVEDYITQDYYICKKSELYIYKSNGIF
jgi:hypothetical protein